MDGEKLEDARKMLTEKIASNKRAVTLAKPLASQLLPVGSFSNGLKFMDERGWLGSIWNQALTLVVRSLGG